MQDAESQSSLDAETTQERRRRRKRKELTRRHLCQRDNRRKKRADKETRDKLKQANKKKRDEKPFFKCKIRRRRRRWRVNDSDEHEDDFPFGVRSLQRGPRGFRGRFARLKHDIAEAKFAKNSPSASLACGQVRTMMDKRCHFHAIDEGGVNR